MTAGRAETRQAAAAVLREAATLAGAEPTASAATRVAWQHLHTDRALIGAVFRAWADAEQVDDIHTLAGVLHRRHRLPAQVAASLRQAALHRDAGPSEGYDSSGRYTDLPRCCDTCGAHGEYGVPWPCPTARALGATDE
ncbi:hypothetical protein [Pseudonocardia asaccharolytica]|uniref:Uncharacterized protein n=1 Tax=Pseudonocardia asaccharolytica DSM 44247 = NBRC 16224 TaxID=1123024 RepID=A0A511CYN9_9PSEU|nr:hypothetical protein [Pseudonocardia asaccharolytica]GEL17669.1 hypothetical protein PA7_15060 [Pseudonocardia asaccharolytica DSM 44247 = NBRC 16224]